MTIASMVADQFHVWRGGLFAALLLSGSAAVTSRPCSAADPPSAASLFDDGVRAFDASDRERLCPCEPSVAALLARPSVGDRDGVLSRARRAAGTVVTSVWEGRL